MAIKVKRSMLKGKYEWQATGGDDPKKIKLDAKLFNRREGYEVVPMIQKVVDHFGYESEADVRKVEELINPEVREHLPGNLRKREDVFAWLVEKLS